MQRLIERYELIRRAKEDENWCTRLYAACHGDIIFWINNFCWTKDPRKNAIIPITLYEFQEEYILNLVSHIKNKRDILIEKSRDMGITWCTLYTFQWYWLFSTRDLLFNCK